MAFIKDIIQAWWLDLFVMFVLSYHAIDGYYRGLLRMSLDAAGFTVALVISLLAYRFPARLAAQAFGIPHFFASAITFFVLWTIADLLWSQVLMRRLEKRLTPSWKLPRIDKTLGAVPGLMSGALIMSVLLTVLMAFPVPEKIKAQVNESLIAGPLVAVAASLDNAIKPLLGRYGEEGIHLITVDPGADQALELHFTVHDGRFDPKSEQELFRAVNRERRERRLPELEWSNGLRDVARLHSDDMFRRGYFSHNSPEGLTPADRADGLGVEYRTIGENLALAPTVSVAHRGLMGSPAHRENVLKRDFRRVGIGVIDGGVYGKMFTQLFSD
jgi:uncharacterized protein YkwD/uncharacterized membrane protein required for colicin V production